MLIIQSGEVFTFREMGAHAKRTLQGLLPVLACVMRDECTSLTGENIRAITLLSNMISGEAGPTLREAIGEINEEMYQGNIFNKPGTEVHH